MQFKNTYNKKIKEYYRKRYYTQRQKECASSPLLTYVLYVLTALRACVPLCLCLLRAFLNALRALIFLRALCAFTFLRALRVFIFLRALRTFIFYVLYVSSFFTWLSCLHFLRALRVFIFYLNYIPSVFYVAYMTSFLYVPYVPSLFKGFQIFKMFYVPLPFFIKCGATQNQLQQAGTSKNKAE